MASRTKQTSPYVIKQRQRQDQALALRAGGWDYPSIARELRYASRSAAHTAVMEALNRQPMEDAPHMRDLELGRLDSLLRVALDHLHAEHPLVSDGRIVCDNQGAALVDYAAQLAALDRVIRIMERRSKLMGLDAPVRKIIETVSEDALDKAIRELEVQVAANEPAQ